MPVKKRVVRPERRKQIAAAEREKAKSVAFEVKDAAAEMLETARVLSKAKPTNAELGRVDKAARLFIAGRAKLIEQHRKQVEASVAVGLSPLKSYDHRLHVNLVKATQFIEKANKLRGKRKLEKRFT